MVLWGVSPPFFHPDSSVPPEFEIPEIHCCHGDLTIILEESRGVRASFDRIVNMTWDPGDQSFSTFILRFTVQQSFSRI